MDVETLFARWRRNAVLAAIGLSLIVVAAFFSWRAAMRAAEIRESDEAEPKILANYEEAKKAFSQGEIDAE